MNIFAKRFCAVFVAVAILASLCMVPAFASEEVAYESDAGYALELLNVLGITEQAYSPDLSTKVSRAEFALLLTGFINAEPAANINSLNFKDVLPGSYEEKYIKFVVSQGYMEVVDDGYFYPAWEITARDAARSLLMALGYGSIAGNEQAFTSFVNRLDLYDGVNSADFTRGEVYKMIYNALMASVMDQTGIKDGELIYEQLKEINGLYYYHDVIRTEGTINGAGGVVLGSGNRSDLEQGFIEMDGYRFVCDFHDMSSVLGRRVYLYWKDIRGSDIDNAVHIEVITEEVLELKASEILDYDNFTYEYEEGDKVKSYTAKKPYVVYNSEEYTGSYTKDIMMPQNGDVTIVKSQGGRDVIIIRSFVDVLVNFVIDDAEAQLIIGKNGERFDVGQSEKGVEYYDTDGFAISLSEIDTDSVISVAKSNSGNKMLIYMSSESVSGELSLIDDTSWTIGETAYSIAPSLEESIDLGNTPAPEFNKNYTFYLNCNGEVAFISEPTQGQSADLFYGVVTGMITGSGFKEDEVTIKVFSKTMGGFETYEIADKVELNGDRKDGKYVAEALRRNGRDGVAGSKFVAQPIKLGLNADNQVNYLLQAAMDNSDGEGFFYFMGSTRPDKKGTFYQYRNVLNYSGMDGRDFAASPKDTGNKQAGYITSTETIQIPYFMAEGDNLIGEIDTASEGAFISATRPSGSMPFVVYKEDDDDLAASLVIRAVEAGEKEHCETTTNIHCILSITERLVNGDVVTCIKTNKMTYYLDNPKINLNALKIWNTLEKADAVEPWIDPETGVQGVHKVIPGDLVNIAADATGYIKAMEIVYDSKNNRMMGKGTGTGASYGYINSDTMWFSRDTYYNLTLLHVLRIDDGYISATDAKNPEDFIADPSVARHYLGAVPPIVCVEESGGKLSSRNAVNSDLIGYYDSPEDHATVILSHRYAQQSGTSYVIKK